MVSIVKGRTTRQTEEINGVVSVMRDDTLSICIDFPIVIKAFLVPDIFIMGKLF